MKLVYVINSWAAGGAERHLLQLVRDMVRRGHSVWVVVLRNEVPGGALSLSSDFALAGARLEVLPTHGMGEIGRWASLIRRLRELRPDILHSHLPRSDLAAAITKAALRDIVWICTIHDAYTAQVYSGHWIFPLLKWNWRRADRLVAVSEYAKRWAVGTLGFEENRAKVIYHGTDAVPDLPDTTPASARDRRPVIGCLARYEPRKGIETLVRAMGKVCEVIPGARLILAGADPTGYSSEIKRLVKTLGLDDNVEVGSFCPTPLEFLKRLDVFAFASISEGFGIVLIEAMSVGVPVVACDIYPMNYIVQHGRTGLLAPPGDSTAIAAAIVDLATDPDKSDAMGKAGHRRCIEEFSSAKAMEKIHALYIESLEGTVDGASGGLVP